MQVHILQPSKNESLATEIVCYELHKIISMISQENIGGNRRNVSVMIEQKLCFLSNIAVTKGESSDHVSS